MLRIGYEMAAKELLAAFVFGFGLGEVGLGNVCRRERRAIAGFGRVAGGTVIVGLQLQQYVAFFHLLSFLHGQFNDFAADFGVDHYLHDGLDFAIGDDNFGDIAAADLLGLHDDNRFLLADKEIPSAAAGS